MRTPAFVWMAGLALLGAAPAVAQEPGDTTPPPVRAPDAQLVFEREVFAYPMYERRNPFVSLVANQASGPRFEQMRLEGILYSPDPSFSLAVFSANRRAATAETAGQVGQVRRLRVGERWGNVRILEIRSREVVVEVEEFGLTEQRIMTLPTRGQGGSR